MLGSRSQFNTHTHTHYIILGVVVQCSDSIKAQRWWEWKDRSSLKRCTRRTVFDSYTLTFDLWLAYIWLLWLLWGCVSVAKVLRRLLDRVGLAGVAVVAADGSWEIASSLLVEPLLYSSVDVIGWVQVSPRASQGAGSGDLHLEQLIGMVMWYHSSWHFLQLKVNMKLCRQCLWVFDTRWWLSGLNSACTVWLLQHEQVSPQRKHKLNTIVIHIHIQVVSMLWYRYLFYQYE